MNLNENENGMSLVQDGVASSGSIYASILTGATSGTSSWVLWSLAIGAGLTAILAIFNRYGKRGGGSSETGIRPDSQPRKAGMPNYAPRTNLAIRRKIGVPSSYRPLSGHPLRSPSEHYRSYDKAKLWDDHLSSDTLATQIDQKTKSNDDLKAKSNDDLSSDTNGVGDSKDPDTYSREPVSRSNTYGLSHADEAHYDHRLSNHWKINRAPGLSTVDSPQISPCRFNFGSQKSPSERRDGASWKKDAHIQELKTRLLSGKSSYPIQPLPQVVSSSRVAEVRRPKESTMNLNLDNAKICAGPRSTIQIIAADYEAAPRASEDSSPAAEKDDLIRNEQDLDDLVQHERNLMNIKKNLLINREDELARSGQLEILDNLAPRGLVNLSNTCFVNSSMQCLLSLPWVVAYFTENTFDTSKVFSNAFKKLISDYENNYQNLFATPYDPSRSREEPCNPIKFIKSIVGQMERLFPRDPEHQDAEEFLNIFLDKLIEEQGKNTFLSNLLNVKIGNVLKCRECGTLSVVTETQPILGLVMNGSIQESFAKFENDEECLENDNKYACAHCDRLVDAVKTQKILSTHRYLIVRLNRFVNIRNKLRKNNEDIAIDRDIAVAGESYSCIGILAHRGGLDSGHYFCKVTRDRSYMINDENVIETDNEVYENMPYLVFYERNDY